MTTSTTDLSPESFLPADVLTAMRDRAAELDRDNRFFDEDLAALRNIGYLRLLVPTELGGFGASLAQVSRIQRTLAKHAPSVALGLNMHQVIVGAALYAYRKDPEDAGARTVLEAAARDELHAFGISEAGNEAMLFDAFTEAAPDGDGYRFTGTKIFTTLTPAWDRLVAHAKRTDASENEETPLVFAWLPRTEEIETVNDWDTHGMRATQSHTTHVKNARVTSEQIITRAGVGPNQNPFVFGIFGAFELFLASVYIGIAERAVELGVDIATKRKSRTRGIMHTDDPDVRWRIADAALEVDGIILQLEKILADFDALREGVSGPGITYHGMRWFLHFSGVKSRATQTAIAAVDQILRASGGAHFYRRSELERISRDVRAGMYQPSDEESVHASYAKALLGDFGAVPFEG